MSDFPIIPTADFDGLPEAKAGENAMTKSRLNYSTNDFERKSRSMGKMQLVEGVSGRFSYVLIIESENSVERRIRIGDPKQISFDEATMKANQIVEYLFNAAATSKDCNGKNSNTFSDFIENYYIPFVTSYQRSTGATLSYLRNWIVPIIGRNLLNEVDRGDIMLLMRSMELSGLKASSVNRALNIVKSAFSKAIEWKLTSITVSPAQGIPELHNNVLNDRFLSHDEGQRLIDSVRSSRNLMLFPIVGFLLMTGARRSEAFMARWDHIDFKKLVWFIPLSKSGKPRSIPLSQGALFYLSEAKRVADNNFHENNPFVFFNLKNGKPFKNIFSSWDAARTKAGLSDVRLHDLRHSFASAMVNTGLNIYDVKELLGHSSVQTTQRYAHLSQDRLAAATDAVFKYFDLEKDEKNKVK